MKEEILKFLQNQHIATLATVTKDNRPHAAVILYAVDQDLNLYFATHKKTEKIDNVKQNNKVSLTIWKHKELSVQIEGEGEEVTDSQECSKILEVLAVSASKENSDFYPPILRIKGQDYAIYKIKPTRCRYLDFKDEHINESSPTVHELTL